MKSVSLSKGTTKLNCCYGMSSFTINNLVVFTFKIRVHKYSLMARALEYGLKYEDSLPACITHQQSKPTKHNPFGNEMTVFKFATTSSDEATRFHKAWATAKARVLMYEADRLLGKKQEQAEPWFGTVPVIDDLPF